MKCAQIVLSSLDSNVNMSFEKMVRVCYASKGYRDLLPFDGDT